MLIQAMALKTVVNRKKTKATKQALHTVRNRDRTLDFELSKEMVCTKEKGYRFNRVDMFWFNGASSHAGVRGQSSGRWVSFRHRWCSRHRRSHSR
jgi:hypothetical protein